MQLWKKIQRNPKSISFHLFQQCNEELDSKSTESKAGQGCESDRTAEGVQNVFEIIHENDVQREVNKLYF